MSISFCTTVSFLHLANPRSSELREVMFVSLEITRNFTWNTKTVLN